MAELADRKPVLGRRTEVEPLRALRTTLGEHYQKKLEHYSVDAPRAYDRDLLRIFSNNPRHRHSPPAAAFIRHHRGDIRRLVSKWTGEYPLTLDQAPDEMVQRGRELKLPACGPQPPMQTG